MALPHPEPIPAPDPPTAVMPAPSTHDQLLAAQRGLAASEARFRALADTVPAMIWIADEDNLGTYYNRPWLEFAGRPLEAEAGLGWTDRIHPEDRERCVAICSGAFAKREEFRMELRLRRHDGQYRWLLDHGVPRFDEARRFLGYIGSCVDITDRKETQADLQRLNETLEERVLARTAELSASEEALRRQSDLLRLVLNSMGEGVVVVDEAGRVLQWNTAARRILGEPTDLPPSEWPRHYAIRLASATGEVAALPIQRALRGEAVSGAELKIHDAPGAEPTWISSNSRPLRDADGAIRGAVAVFRDITPQKLSEEEIERYQRRLRSLASELVVTEQRERRRIAEGLHDHLGQLLAATKMVLSTLKPGIAAGEPTRSLSQAMDLLTQAIQYTRTLTSELSPPVLYDLGLEAALRWLAQQFAAQYGLQVTVTAEPDAEPKAEESRLALFTAAREALFNCVKHARTHSAEVTVTREGDRTQVVVEDRGAGFDPTTRVGDGFGLFNIRERLDLLGGGLTIDSEPGRGTRVTLRAPVEIQKR